MVMNIINAQLKAAAILRDAMEKIIEQTGRTGSADSGPMPSWIYNPLTYAWPAFEEYVTRYGKGEKRVIFLGMNPGPWGMAQTGVPFGEVSAVRDWLGISAPVGRPSREHPKYPVDGYACKRSEVSGRRLWGLFKERFGRPESFFEDHFVVNYCPLLFIETHGSATSPSKNGKEGARNLTPDKLSPVLRAPLYEACDAHLRALIRALSPQYVIGIGNFAEGRIAAAANPRAEDQAVAGLGSFSIKTGKILHPSPASPRSNSDWGGEATRQLQELGVW
jgi:single-strand selective monofunctional uracil DNA glycosylase